MTGRVEAARDLDRSRVDTTEEALGRDDVLTLIHEGVAISTSGELAPGCDVEYTNRSGSETLVVTGPRRQARQDETFIRPTRVRDRTTFQVNSGLIYPPTRISTVAVGEHGGIEYGERVRATLDRGREVIAGLRSKPTP